MQGTIMALRPRPFLISDTGSGCVGGCRRREASPGHLHAFFSFKGGRRLGEHRLGIAPGTWPQSRPHNSCRNIRHWNNTRPHGRNRGEVKTATATPGPARHVFPRLFIEAVPPQWQRAFDSPNLLLGKILGTRFFSFLFFKIVSTLVSGPMAKVGEPK